MSATPRRRRPLVDAGLPTRCHPESLERVLPEGDEEWLYRVRRELWPLDEYDEIIREVRPVIRSSRHAGACSRPPAPCLRNDACMPISPSAVVRVPVSLESAARKAAPELAGLSLSELLRAGLAVLAGASSPAEAAAAARLTRAPHQRGGGRRKTAAVPESSEVRAPGEVPAA